MSEPDSWCGMQAVLSTTLRVVNIGSTSCRNCSTASQSPIAKLRGDRAPNVTARHWASTGLSVRRALRERRQRIERQIRTRELVRPPVRGRTGAGLRLRVRACPRGDEQYFQLIRKTVAGVRGGEAHVLKGDLMLLP